MIEAIVYNSHTDFSKQYAYNLAVRCKLPIYSLNESKKLKEGTEIIYFSWIKNGRVMDLDRAKKKFIIQYVCSVGLYPYSDERIQELKMTNKIDNLFYLRGGLRYYKLNLMERNVFNDIRKNLERKAKRVRLSNEENDILFIVTNGLERIDLDALNPLIELINDEKENFVM
jgi:hypothetical protein